MANFTRSSALLVGSLIGSLVAASVAGAEPPRAPLGPRDSLELLAVVDSVVGVAMSRDLIPGVAFVFVRNGKVFAARGYGAANISTGARVDLDSTLWRIGAISEAITATAVMQQVERGALRIDRDVNAYLQGIRVPVAGAPVAGAPVTVHSLLSHTSGLDDSPTGRQARDSASVLPLADYLRERLVRSRPVGGAPSRSTTGVTLAGLLVVQASGMTLERYLSQRIFKPLGMTRTAITLSEEQREFLSPGYEAGQSWPITQQYEWYHATPALSINATVADMARFMIAHLAMGGVGEGRIMSRATAKTMHATHGRGHPDVPGVAYGFLEADYAGVRVLEQRGTMAGQSSVMTLLPEQGVGFLIVHHFARHGLRDAVKFAILDRFYSANARARPAIAMSRTELERFAGRYRPIDSCHSCGAPGPTDGATVTVNEDGTIGFAAQTWRPIGPLLFQRIDGKRVLGFRADRDARVTGLYIDGALSFERID